jgi:hypothetical protein
VELAWDAKNGRVILLVESADASTGAVRSPLVLAVSTSGAISTLWSDIDDDEDAGAGGLAVDGSGNIFLQGAASGGGLYARRIAEDGSETWLGAWGSTGADTAFDLVVASGFVYATGALVGTPQGANVMGTHGGGTDAAVVKLAASDGAQQWARIFGTSSADAAVSVGVDGGNLRVAGHTAGTLGSSAFGGVDLFTATLTTAGAAPTLIHQYGSSGDDIPGRPDFVAEWYIPATSYADWTGQSRDACTYDGAGDALLANFCSTQ